MAGFQTIRKMGFESAANLLNHFRRDTGVAFALFGQNFVGEIFVDVGQIFDHFFAPLNAQISELGETFGVGVSVQRNPPVLAALKMRFKIAKICAASLHRAT